MSSAPYPSSARSLVVLVIVALAPLWLWGLFGRGLWTPDEPREADIAWRMSLQSDHTLPQLAGTPFLEKPPLSYWMSGAAIAVFGDTAAAARVPNLAYALTAALALALLALAMHGEARAALLAALIGGSALLAFRVSIWLAPDACLLAGCTLALLGAWCGYRAAPGRAKAAGYALMHVGAALGFMAKSAPGWLVPALALLALIAWERRFAELRRWELYAGLALQALIIGPWLWAVASGAHGAEALRALFWHNVVGRFTQIAAPAALDYTSGHPNRFGKYLLELPLYLLPWTLIAAAALARAWRVLRSDGARASAWRFALCACVPFLLLLSCAATARDIYAAPAVAGFALLVGLWAIDAERAPQPLDALAVTGTALLSALLALALAAALAVFYAAGASGVVALVAAAATVLGALAALPAWRAARRGRLQLSLLWSYGAYALTLSCAAFGVLPVIDRWQDLPGLARHIREDTAARPLALLDADETTIAVLDHAGATPFAQLTSTVAGAPATVRHWFATQGSAARVLVLLPGHAAGAVSEWLAPGAAQAPDDGAAAQLSAAGAARLIARYELPQGRRYALLGPP